MVADLIALYGVRFGDFLATAHDREVLRCLIERVALEDRSMWVAMRRGGPEHFGWGVDRAILARIPSEVRFVADVTAKRGSKKRAKYQDLIPAPEVSRVQKPSSLAEVDGSFFML